MIYLLQNWNKMIPVEKYGSFIHFFCSGKSYSDTPWINIWLTFFWEAWVQKMKKILIRDIIDRMIRNRKVVSGMVKLEAMLFGRSACIR